LCKSQPGTEKNPYPNFAINNERFPRLNRIAIWFFFGDSHRKNKKNALDDFGYLTNEKGATLLRNPLKKLKNGAEGRILQIVKENNMLLNLMWVYVSLSEFCTLMAA
jgi:hypothetical protein